MTQLWDLARVGGSFPNWLSSVLPLRSQKALMTSCIDPKPAGYLWVSISSHKLFNTYRRLREKIRSHCGASSIRTQMTSTSPHSWHVQTAAPQSRPRSYSRQKPRWTMGPFPYKTLRKGMISWQTECFDERSSTMRQYWVTFPITEQHQLHAWPILNPKYVSVGDASCRP